MLHISGGYVWSYGIVLAGIVIGAIYVLIRIQFHQWKDIQEDCVYLKLHFNSSRYYFELVQKNFFFIYYRYKKEHLVLLWSRIL